MSCHDEEGVSLVELMVAMLVLGIVMAGVTATMASSLSLTRESQAVSVATGLATASMETALAQSFDDTEDEVDTPAAADTETVGGRTYTTTRSVRWVAASAVTGACVDSPGAGDANVLLVDVSVDWVGRTEPQPVSQQTTLAPPVGRYDPNAGTLAVYVAGSEDPPAPAQGVTVRANGPNGTLTATTGADGCAVFGGIDAGSYEVSLEKAGYIDKQQRTVPVEAGQAVGVGSRTPVELSYAPWTTIDATVAGREGGRLPLTPLTVSVAAGDEVWEVGDTSDQPAELRVWPDDYELFAGDCEIADPEGLRDETSVYWDGASRGDSIASTPAVGSPDATVTVGSLQLQWGEGWTDGNTLQAFAVATGDCSQGTSRLDLGTVTAGTAETFALPWGSWRLELREEGRRIATSSDALLDPRTPGLVPVVVDRPADVCAGQLPRHVANGGSVAGFGSSFTLSIPDAAQPGDLLLFSAWVENSASNRPSGWTKTAEHDFNDSSYDLALYTRVADGSESSVTITTGSDAQFKGHIIVMRDVGGRQDATEVGQYDNETLRDSLDVAAARVEEDDSLIVLVAGSRRGDNVSVSSDSLDPDVLGGPEVRTSDDAGFFRGLVSTYLGYGTAPSTSDYEISWEPGVNFVGGLLVTFDPACQR